jgi:hypothetical protein
MLFRSVELRAGVEVKTTVGIVHVYQDVRALRLK